ncbi:hypothetical protein QBC47DRAFT_291098 [Echria macrotheca]|uniref:Uncharacterized protein n=1 Tax=Echria macrotheca TaxID=438768 RepID=A0AAJ0BNF3_9PEZI|nr:hypothetical protein QBC47DRAFT_291098 [Echria macrotheca]
MFKIQCFPLILAMFSILTTAQDTAPATNNTLQPWEVTTVNTFSPSGRPGNPPYSYLYVSISDPNTIPTGFNVRGDLSFPPIAANCTVMWNAYAEEPFGWVSPCPDTHFQSGRWTVEIQPQNRTGYGPSATRDFKLRFVLERSMIVNNGILSKTFVGVGAFSRADNNLDLVCGASGVCSSGLKVDKVLITQELTGSKLSGWN